MKRKRTSLKQVTRDRSYGILKTYFRGDPKYGRTTTLTLQGKPVFETMGVSTKRAMIKQYENASARDREAGWPNPGILDLAANLQAADYLAGKLGGKRRRNSVYDHPGLRGERLKFWKRAVWRAHHHGATDKQAKIFANRLIKIADYADDESIKKAWERWSKGSVKGWQGKKINSSPVNEWDDPAWDNILDEGSKLGSQQARALGRSEREHRAGVKRYNVSWYSGLKKKRTSFMQPIEAHSAAEAKRQGKAMVENDPKAKNFIAKEIKSNPRLPRNRIGRNYAAVVERLTSEGVNFDSDYHELDHSQQVLISDAAKRAGYRAPKSASGSTGRYFYALLQRQYVKRNPTISEKISQLTDEGYPQKQAVAIAFSEKRAGKLNPGFDWNNVRRFNFTYAIPGGAWLEDTKGNMNWYPWKSILNHKGEKWRDRQLKKQGEFTGTWIEVDNSVKNPSTREMSQRFQGEANGKIQELHAANSAPSDLSRAGKLIFLKLRGQKDALKIPGAVVCIDPKKEKLWIAGPVPMFNRKAKAGEVLDCGVIDKICYDTAKKHIGKGKRFEYVHEFGEEGGRKPHLYIDPEGMPIISGGDYKIKSAGITD